MTTIVGPGELIDVIVTERGIAINPKRVDLLDKMKGSSLPIVSLEQLRDEVYRLVGGAPQKPTLGEKDVAVIKWVDGTVIDTVKNFIEK